jgi:thymidylate synthase
VTNGGELDLTLYLRSSDFALGLPFNIAQYALLTHLYARAAGLTPRYLHVNIGDAHIYLNHVLAMRQVLTAEPYDSRPRLVFNTENTDIDGYNVEDFRIENYVYGPFVKLEVAL